MSTAVLFDRYGGPGVLYPAEVPDPVAGPGQVVVRHTAIGVNPIDWKILSGEVREHVPMDLPGGCLGVEAAGVVVEVGAGVRRFRVGDPVVRHGRPGAFREYEALAASQHADELTLRPDRFSDEQAAVLPVAAGTAYSALRRVGLGPGDRLLVHGASGGVGLAVVQLALLLGADEVVGTASPARHGLVRAAGATPVGYGEGLAERLAEHGPFHASIDCAGGPESTAAAVRLVAGAARRVTIVPDAAARARGIPLLEHFPLELASTLDLLGTAAFELPVAARYPLEQAGEALAHSLRGGVGGKIVLVPGG
ncbi:NADP-dependent oxidoreductase [Streptomyces sp. NBC_00096]|uniref:NADP-dependent oxidoreductase n=1 Tax=Streptomyces sp. NBC_00096 TaxID=2975650 RepID=UPI0032484A10